MALVDDTHHRGPALDTPTASAINFFMAIPADVPVLTSSHPSSSQTARRQPENPADGLVRMAFH
jgi:hypothetical protein